MFYHRFVPKLRLRVDHLLTLHLLTLIVAVCFSLSWGYMAHAQTLRIGNAGEPQTLDPHRYNLRLEETLLNDLFVGLTTFNAFGELVPGAAESWHTSADGLTWTFSLRRDLRWSDGTTLTAADFVYAFRRLQNPNTAASLAYFMYMVKNAAAINSGQLSPEQLGVSAPDPFTFVIELEQPYPYLLERLLYPTAYPVPAHVIQKHGDKWTQPENWVSNGAYMLGEWQPQAYVAFHRNPHFFAPAQIESVRYYPVVSEQSAYNRFRNNELHAIGSFPIGELEKVRRNYSSELQISDLLSMMYLVFNTQKKPFDDVRVRRALSLGIDQAVLTDKVLRSGAKPAYSFVPGLVEQYSAVEFAHKAVAYSERIQNARALLQEAGFDRNSPLKLVLRHVNGVENKKLNLAITGMWRQLGVQAVLQQAELRNHFADLRQGDFDVAWAGWIGENNPEHYLTLLQSDIGNVNYGRFYSQAYDAILRDAQQMAELDTRNARLQQAEALVVKEYAVIPLYTSAVRRLVSNKITGWHPNLRDMHQVRYLRFAPSAAP